jgi:hypothetical protein
MSRPLQYLAMMNLKVYDFVGAAPRTLVAYVKNGDKTFVSEPSHIVTVSE